VFRIFVVQSLFSLQMCDDQQNCQVFVTLVTVMRMSAAMVLLEDAWMMEHNICFSVFSVSTRRVRGPRVPSAHTLSEGSGPGQESQ
jgi:hypothetical protein